MNKMNLKRNLGISFVFLSIIISAVNINITGAVIGSSLSNSFSFIAVIFLVVGVLLMSGRDGDKDSGNLEKTIKLYHGALDTNEAETIRMWGPSKDRPFFLTRSHSIAKRDSEPNREIITFEIPESEFEKYREIEKPYLGMFGEGGQFEVSGELATNLKNYLSEKDKRRLY